MGQFSWLDCVTGEQILDDVHETSYLLVPKEFGGGAIAEECYDGYGNFGGHDVYELVAEWNRNFVPVLFGYADNNKWECDISDDDRAELEKFYRHEEISCEKRVLGIIMATYNKDNARLFYPIKVTYKMNAVYESCAPSKYDPNQGWLVDEYGNQVEWYEDEYQNTRRR